MHEDLHDDLALLKQLLAQLLIEHTVDKGHIVDHKEQIKLLRDLLFGRKSEQTSTTTLPNEQSDRLPLDEKRGCSAIRPKAPPPAPRSQPGLGRQTELPRAL